jgi:hypothetical protein
MIERMFQEIDVGKVYTGKIVSIIAKCLGVDEKGRVKMSRRAWLRDQKAAEAATPAE